MNSSGGGFANFHDFDVQLYRDSLSRPWGFRIQGGADFNFPLTVQRVFSGSPSESKLLRGDVILAIDGYDVGRLTHKQAQDVVRVAGASLTIRVRRQGSGPMPSSAYASPSARRPHSTTPRTDPAATYFSSNQPPKPTWHPPPAKAAASSSTFGNFGVQYGPARVTSSGSTSTSPLHRQVASASHSPQVRTETPPGEEESALQRVEDSLHKLAMNHFNNDEEEVDYSFMKKSVRERRQLFLDNDRQPQNDARPRSTSCQPTFRAASYSSQFSAPAPAMTSSYTEPARPAGQANLMSSSYTEGSRSRPAASPAWQRPGGSSFGWSPSPEKLSAARHRPHVSAVSQVQHSVIRSRESSRESSPEAAPWAGFQAPLMRSTSVSVLQESPTRATIQRHVESSAPRTGDQRLKLFRGPFEEVGRWSISSHYQSAPSTPRWRVDTGYLSTPRPVKKFSTSAVIRVGQSNDRQPSVRKVRRFSASSTPIDGTMSLDRRHHEPLKISIGTACQADYRPAYPANVLYREADRSWVRPTQQQPPLQRTASHKVPQRKTARAEAGTYRPLQQSYSSQRSFSASDPDYMSSDF